MTRAYNFCAGPAAMPEPVLARAQQELMNWGKSGASIMEMSHRSATFQDIARHAERGLRDLMHIPDDYAVLFLQGGASTQFAVIPMNLLRGRGTADYVRTGIWSDKAIEQAGKYGKVRVVADSSAGNHTSIPEFSTWDLDPNAAYVHYTPNETVGGLEFDWIPDTGDVPLVADMSSTILSRPFDVTKFALIYAGAQKNIGPSGITVVIVRRDLLGEAMPETPIPFNYAVQDKDASLYNTPPTFAWYLADLVFDWLKAQGGPEAMAVVNQRKAQKLYDAIDAGDFYRNKVSPECRSWMNVPFQLPDKSLDPVFLSEAEKVGLLNLNGFRTVGGMRASLYNAVPEAGVDRLVQFMNEFESRYG
ncbi:MAG: 3-phosphoserine/phosphohydroxythreonine transaminase [Gammaproteobacteria bacterium]|nr:3-phosphoserine/phosphohydroxythreonine transaminase [Gammaproteobacteria bacterium]